MPSTWTQTQRVRIPENIATVYCETQCEHEEVNPDPLQEQQLFLTTEKSICPFVLTF